MARAKKLPKGIVRHAHSGYMGRFKVDGEQYCLYDRDVKVLEEKMEKMKYELKNGLYVKEEKISCDKWFRIWMEEYKKNAVKFGTYETYERTYKLYVQPEIGKKQIKDIRPDQIQKIYNKMAEKSLSHKTICLSAIVVGGMFKQAYKNQMIARNPVELTTKPRNKELQKHIKVLSKDEQAVFLRYAKDSAYYYLYLVSMGTGLRVGEIRALQWDDINFEKKIIHVNGTLKCDKERGYFKDTPKTRTSRRDVPMIPEVEQALRKQKKQQFEERISLGQLWKPVDGLENFVFTGYYTYHGFGKNLCSNAINHDMAKIEERIRHDYPDFPHITPHVLRHTFATRGLENNIPLKVMQDLLGHTSITMTADIYSHVLPDIKAQEIQKVSGMFG